MKARPVDERAWASVGAAKEPQEGPSSPPRRAAVCVWARDTPEATEAAKRALAARARAHGATVTLRLVVRRADAGRPSKHWLCRLLAAAEGRRIDVVYVESLDVFGASPPTILKAARRLSAAGVTVVSLGEPWFNPDDPFADWFVRAEQHRAQLSAAALAAKRARGERTGQIPRGSRLADDGVMEEPYPYEREMIARARVLHAERLGDSAIARVLTSEGFTSRVGTRLWHTQVARMLGKRKR